MAAIKAAQRRWIQNCAWAPEFQHVTNNASITVKSGAFRGVENRNTLLQMQGQPDEAAAIVALAEEQARRVAFLEEEPHIARFLDLSFLAMLVWDDEKPPVKGRRFGTFYCVVIYTDQENDFIRAFKA